MYAIAVIAAAMRSRRPVMTGGTIEPDRCHEECIVGRPARWFNAVAPLDHPLPYGRVRISR